jgi:hypothetical protein
VSSNQVYRLRVPHEDQERDYANNAATFPTPTPHLNKSVAHVRLSVRIPIWWFPPSLVISDTYVSKRQSVMYILRELTKVLSSQFSVLLSFCDVKVFFARSAEAATSSVRPPVTVLSSFSFGDLRILTLPVNTHPSWWITITPHLTWGYLSLISTMTLPTNMVSSSHRC